MKISEICFKDYKAYNGDGGSEKLQQMRLAPLTLFFGKNNSGKSAAIRLPRLLLGGLECDDARVLPVDVRGLSYGANFLDLVHGGAFFRRPEFHILGEHNGDKIDLSVTLYSPTALSADDPPRIWSYMMRMPKLISISGPPEPDATAPAFQGLLPPDAYWDPWRKAVRALLDEMVHLGPTRSPVLAAYSNEQFAGLDLRGTQAPQLLRIDSMLADEVGRWYAENMDGWRLVLKRDNDSFSLQLKRTGPLSTNLSQGGEGLQQVLPVVVHQLWRQRQGIEAAPFLDVVEQPELHLHADVQAPLADLFIDTALQGRGQILVETNSEPILLRVQRRIAEGYIAPNQVALYFVDVTKDKSELRSIKLHPDGEVDWWPAGVFEADFTEVAAIRRAQKAREPQRRQS